MRSKRQARHSTHLSLLKTNNKEIALSFQDYATRRIKLKKRFIRFRHSSRMSWPCIPRELENSLYYVLAFPRAHICGNISLA